MGSKKTTAVAVAAGALALGAGLGAATLAAADPTVTPTASPSQSASADPGAGRDGAGGPGGRGHGREDLAEQLADRLGISQDKVAEALREVRGDRPAPGTASPTPGTQPDPAARDARLAASLAEQLGVSEDTVKTALAEIRAAAQAERTAALKEKLDAAVRAGTLTQAEADAVVKAADLGVVNVGPR
jgi:hypothetical protein